ncbi:Hypothetical protein NTJ_04543 [Nesidiocoris tenuis]|uniref:Protein sleepless n=1 Tax=Nesidiocoris tenuis TaxID=355587 RepID=A0ABN7AHK0_9HEMI|nr:Hypothetical protein NTJ_04543 [Nesidiocoris tenuis]
MKSCNVAVLFAVICLAASGHGLKCYQCSGDGCGDTYVPKTDDEMTCTPSVAQKALAGFKDVASKVSSALGDLGINVGSVNAPDLKLICAKVTLKQGEVRRVSRSCAATSKEADFCATLNEQLKDNVECSVCEGDLCNAASSVQLGVGVMAAAAAILIANFAR